MEALQARFPELTLYPLQKPGASPLYLYSPFHPSTWALPAGHVKSPGRRPFGVASVLEKDVAMVMRDKTTLYADIFRPASSDGADKVPAIIAWSPYGKDGGCQRYDTMGPFRCGVPVERTSGYEKFEGPDPAEWCERGYAVVNVDARGAGDSEGSIALWGEQDALDFHDTVEFLSTRPWCNGSVTGAGNSWLAISQLNAAARAPHPALKAIAPWEGATDVYRDLIARGGIAKPHFMVFIFHTLAGQRGIENTPAMVPHHPLFDEYWATKTIPVENIRIPLYLTASYSTGLHSRASFATFARAQSADKWLRVHPYQEWYDLYRPDVNDELQAFFDRYCKGADNSWALTPRLRLSLIGFDESPAPTILERAEASFPVPGTEHRTYYLDAQSLRLDRSPPAEASVASYDAHHLSDTLDFALTFDRYTELAGYPVVKLWMSCAEHDDMDVVVQIRKVAAGGSSGGTKDQKLLANRNYPCPLPVDEVPSSNVAKFLGPDGMLRASHRVSRADDDGDDDKTGRPYYRHDRAEKIPPGQVVDLSIALWPIGMVFAPGEGIVLRIAGHDLRLPELFVPAGGEPDDANVGRHCVHTGGTRDSYLVLPIVPERRV